MTFKDYQKQASRTLIDKPDFEITDKQIMIVWCAVGIADEVSEVIDVIDNFLNRYDSNVDYGDQLKKEVGDVMWYLAGLCTTMGIPLKTLTDQDLKPVESITAVFQLNRFTGMFMEGVKKGIFHQQDIYNFHIPLAVSQMIHCLSGLLFYFSMNLEECMSHNIEKLKARFPDGWDHNRASFKEGLAD